MHVARPGEPAASHGTLRLIAAVPLLLAAVGLIALILVVSGGVAPPASPVDARSADATGG